MNKDKFEFTSEKVSRLDIFLSEKLNLSRNQTVQMIKNSENNIWVNSKEVKKVGFKLSENDLVKILINKRVKEVSEARTPKIRIIFENEGFLILDKPHGISTIDQNPGKPSVANFLKSERLCDTMFESYPQIGGLVHRIDKETAGLLICAKTLESYDELKKMFRDREIKKIYEAISSGDIVESGTIKSGLRKLGRKVFVSEDKKSKKAETKFWRIDTRGRFNFLEINILTGRTHQIRVHLSFIGSPVLGDNLYSGISFKPMCLVAKRLSFNLKNQNYSFESSYNLKSIFNRLI